MRFLNLYWTLSNFIKLFFFNLIYGKRMRIPFSTKIRSGFQLIIDGEGNVTIGNGCFFNNYCSLSSLNSIVIGEGSIFGESVKIYDHNHIYIDKEVPFQHSGFSDAPVVVGNRCWIGSNVVILKGVTIGDNCVIGAGCVIFKDIPANSVVISNQNLQIKTY